MTKKLFKTTKEIEEYKKNFAEQAATKQAEAVTIAANEAAAAARKDAEEQNAVTLQKQLCVHSRHCLLSASSHSVSSHTSAVCMQ